MSYKVSRRQFVAAAGIAPILRAAQGPSTDERAAIRALAEAYLQEQSTPGLSVAFARDGELVHAEGFGLTDEHGERVEPRHMFRIASVSKPITSTAIFTLIEQGKLALGDKVFGPGSILGEEFGRPPYRPYVNDIRLVHLLTHTAGGWQNDGNDPMFRHEEMDHRQLITWTVANQDLNHPPGEKYAYSNF